MRVSERDLDNNLLEKVNRLDNVVSSYNSNIEGFLSYNKDGFYFKQTNDDYLKQLLSEDDIINMKKNIDEPAVNVVSSKYTNILKKASTNKAVETFYQDLQGKFLFLVNKNIIKYKIYSNDLNETVFVCLLDDLSFIVYNVSTKQTYIFNIASELETKFSLVNIPVYSLNDFFIDKTLLYFSLFQHGVYKYDLSSKELSMVSNKTDIEFIDLLPNQNIFCIGSDSIAVYSKEEKISEEFYQLRKLNQHPKFYLHYKDKYFVIGKNYGVDSSKKLVHAWKYNGLDLENIDEQIENNIEDQNYEIKYATIYQDKLYITGVNHYDDTLFIWAYNLLTLRLEDINIPKIKLDQYYNILFYNEKILLSYKDMLKVLDKGLLHTYHINSNIQKLTVYDQLYYMNDNKIYQLDLPVYSTADEIMNFKIYNKQNSCNTIDIYIDNYNGKSEDIVFSSGSNIIEPLFKIIDEGNAYIRLYDCKETSIDMQLHIYETTSIKGIAIKENKIFLR
jgi:hypothetical protein